MANVILFISMLFNSAPEKIEQKEIPLWEKEMVFEGKKPEIPLHKRKVIGKAEWCAIGPVEVDCVDHTLAQCLRTLSLTPGGIVCETKEDFKRIQRESKYGKY